MNIFTATDKNVFVNDSDYESPDEDTINKKVENIEINDIPDVTEPIYDNPNIIENPEGHNKLKKQKTK